MKRSILLILVFSALAVSGCQKKTTSSKIMDSFPVNTLETVIPSKTAQEWFLLNRDLASSLVSFLYRTQNYIPPVYPELTPLGGFQYRFLLSNNRYGNASMTIQFCAGPNNPVDPTVLSSSITITEVDVTGLSGTSPDFSYTESAPITLFIQTAGNLSSLLSLAGAITFTGINSGAGYSMVFTNDLSNSPGISCSNNGLIGGRVNASGTGPTALTTLSLSFDIKHNAFGPVTWEGNQGEIHMNSTGTGILITSQTRIPIT